MSALIPKSPLLATAYTVVIGALGAGLALAFNLPAWILLGPAVATSLAGIGGIRLVISDPVRDLCFIVLGLGIGAGFDADTSRAILRWPLAFVVLAGMLAATMALCRLVLIRGFRFDPRSATLASAPGHLSFVLSLAADLNIDVARIAVVQSIRLLFLTISVPFVAQAMGYDFGTLTLSAGIPMVWPVLAALALAAAVLGAVYSRLRFPAPLLLSAMTVSAVGHVSTLTPGAVPEQLLTPAFLVLGTMIGTRFAGISRAQFLGSLLAGVSTTLISVIIACLAALPVSLALHMPTAHVLAAFAPGGLETMIALGAVMGASPGFVAACHVARLFILMMLIPLFLGGKPAQGRGL